MKPDEPASGRNPEDRDPEWRERLSPEQYQVTRCSATERAFTGKYWNHHEDGLYRCVCCGAPLFGSETKFESGSGWPSFRAPAPQARISEHVDRSYGMVRTEVRCASCEAHLGHLFPDGPAPEGLRYCINSAALDFQPASPPSRAAAADSDGPTPPSGAAPA